MENLFFETFFDSDYNKIIYKNTYHDGFVCESYEKYCGGRLIGLHDPDDKTPAYRVRAIDGSFEEEKHYHNGKLHCAFGPARKYTSPVCTIEEYFLNGQHYNKNEYKIILGDLYSVVTKQTQGRMKVLYEELAELISYQDGIDKIHAEIQAL